LYTSCMLRGAYAFYKISLITYQKNLEKAPYPLQICFHTPTPNGPLTSLEH